jgi:hypothetical protein
VDTLWVAELVIKVFGALNVATMICVPIPPSCRIRTALPLVPRDCTCTVESTWVTLLNLSVKVTVPVLIGVTPAATDAVIVKTSPLAALAGVTVSAVVVVVCAPATTKDIPINNAAHREVTRLLQIEVLPQVFASLEILDVLSPSPETCGDPITPEGNVVRRRVCESKFLTATRDNQREPDVALADEADRQTQSGDAALREDFMIAGISEPFD